MNELPVVVIGAGPQGLAAAAHLRERGLEPLVFEAGAGPASAVMEWAHVRLFSGWSELVDAAAARLLEPTGWAVPLHGYPTGEEWVASYLSPLANALGDRVRYGTRVTGVGRRGRDRLVDGDRNEQPFTVHLVDNYGVESRIEARAVIDASGTWSQPNPAGADGLPALGERSAARWVSYRIPDFADAEVFAGRHTIVVGSGHSATTAVNELSEVAKRYDDTRITWVLRRPTAGNAFGGGHADALPARGALGDRARQSVEAGIVEVVTGFRVDTITGTAAGAVITSEDGRSLPAADRVVVLTGFRPDLSFLSEMRLELDGTLQAPVLLAADIDPNIHTCGTVRATGARELAQPEKGLYLVGAKSYGRAPTFLAVTGYEQVRSVVAELVGDHNAAARVDLVLPESGACGGTGVFDDVEADGSCCAPGQATVQFGSPRSSLGLVGGLERDHDLAEMPALGQVLQRLSD